MVISKGEITFLGASLSASNKVFTVYAPSTHSLPVLRCLGTEVDHAEIVLRRHEGGLQSLYTLSPLFSKIWNEGSGPFGADYSSLLKHNDTSSYQIV